MVLSERLTRIASYVPRGSIVADIGTDHALLPIYLVLEGFAPAPSPVISSRVRWIRQKPMSYFTS